MTDKEFQKFMIEHMVELSAEVKGLRQDVARIEYEHGEKLAALFDGYQVMSDKLDEHSRILNDHTERLQRIEDKVQTHDIKIEVLDKTKSNKRKVK